MIFYFSRLMLDKLPSQSLCGSYLKSVSSFFRLLLWLLLPIDKGMYFLMKTFAKEVLSWQKDCQIPFLYITCSLQAVLLAAKDFVTDKTVSQKVQEWEVHFLGHAVCDEKKTGLSSTEEWLIVSGHTTACTKQNKAMAGRTFPAALWV